jgi:serine/threonine protein kinase
MEGFTLMYYSSGAGSHIYQRFLLNIPGVFPYPFSLLLKKNDIVADCVENSVLQEGLKGRDRLDRAISAFSETFNRNNITLSSFKGWVPQAVTRFSLITRKEDSFPELHIDADPSSVEYQSPSHLLSADGIGPLNSIATVAIDDITVIKSLTARRNIKLVEYGDSQYVLKTIDRHDEMREWEHELKTLLVLRDSPNIIDIIALVDINNPYSPNDLRVVSGFLIEYASLGSLYERLEDIRGKDIEFGIRITWALEIAEGLGDMHARGLVHGDIKPRNVVITSTNVAKLIDFAGKGYTKGYHAPEMLPIIDNDVPWPKTLDIYSLGVLLRELLIDIHDNSWVSELKLKSLISACLLENPNDRPLISDIITEIKQMLGLYA